MGCLHPHTHGYNDEHCRHRRRFDAHSRSCKFQRVLVAGFGWGYKATFLLLAVPAVAALTRSARPALVSSSAVVLILLGVSSVVVWNTVLATFAGVIVARRKK